MIAQTEPQQAMPDARILRQKVTLCDYSSVAQRVCQMAQQSSAAYVCVSNVHMVMTSWDDPDFAAIVNSADIVTPDGMPLVWALRMLGHGEATRVYGPDLTLHVCKLAAREGLPIGLYGGTPESLDQFDAFLSARFPGIQIPCKIAPPFRPLTAAEDAAYTAQIAESGARILFVGIGCPRQERWMATHQNRLNMPMLGVGAAFDFHTGRVRQAPRWMQQIGMEWFFRFLMEPRRLFCRYAWHNPRFVVLLAWQLLSSRLDRAQQHSHPRISEDGSVAK